MTQLTGNPTFPGLHCGGNLVLDPSNNGPRSLLEGKAFSSIYALCEEEERARCVWRILFADSGGSPRKG